MDREFTQEELEAWSRYEEIRESGVTNMFARDLVCELAEITKEQYMLILKNYSEMKKAYESQLA